MHKEFNILDPDSLVTNGSARYAFFNALPDLVVHPSPLQEGDVKAKMKSECQCLQYCWENKCVIPNYNYVLKVVPTLYHFIV